MFIRISMVFVVLLISAAFGCQSTPTNNNAAVNNSANTVPQNLPEGFSTSPIPPSTNSTPGIPPANAINVLPKGATPTPGIPDPKTLNKPRKPGATPTPGIPDAETLRRQLNGQPVGNVNARTPGNNQMMPMKKGVNRPNQ